MTRKKKKGKQSQHKSSQLSPEKYIRQKARNLPLDKCYISKDWEMSGIANVLVVRVHKNGNNTIGIYLIDLKCLGVKETFYMFNEPESRLDKILNNHMGIEMTEIDYPLAHNIIFGGMKFAEKYGFKPYKLWSVTEHILEPDDENIPIVEIEFGDDGKPHYLSGPDDDIRFINRVFNTLHKTAGPGNFHFTSHISNFLLEDDGFDLEEDELDYGEDELDYDEDDRDFDEEYFDHDDRTALDHIKSIAFHYFLIFPDEKPKILPHEIIEDVVIDDEKYILDLNDKDYDYIMDTIEARYLKSRIYQKRGMEDLRDMYSNSPNLLLTIFLTCYEVYGEKSVEIEHLIEQKYPDLVGFILFKSYELTLSENPDKAWELLGKSLKIQEAFPGHENFTSSEFFWFLITCLSYFNAVDDIATALSYVDILINQIEDDFDMYPLATDPLANFCEKLDKKFAGLNIPDY